MKTAILAILMFCIMIFPHELGHFIAAKKCNVKVNEFAFGMGPTIWKKQRGETLHSIRLFPIGGFCAMEGEEGESDDERAFNHKKPWQKIIILAAGSTMNMLCALIIMSAIVGFYGVTTTTLDEVEDGGAAAAAGLEVGDKIVSVTTDAGQFDIEKWTDISSALSEIEDGESITVGYERDGELAEASMTPKLVESTDSDGNTTTRYVLGIMCKISHSPIKAVTNGAKSTWSLTVTMVQSVKQLFTGGIGADDLTGPVGMVQMVGQTNQYGLTYYASLVALICINLAIINMLPLPALDGGRIIFVLYSWITGKPVSEKVEGVIHLIGLGLLLLLMVYVTFNDVIRIVE